MILPYLLSPILNFFLASSLLIILPLLQYWVLPFVFLPLLRLGDTHSPWQPRSLIFSFVCLFLFPFFHAQSNTLYFSSLLRFLLSNTSLSFHLLRSTNPATSLLSSTAFSFTLLRFSNHLFLCLALFLLISYPFLDPILSSFIRHFYIFKY